jgi:GT2 family glycosyltransferase
VPNSSIRSEVSLYVVVVLYERGLSTSATCRSLLNQIAPPAQDEIVLYDNSPRSDLESVPDRWQVVIDPTNGGLSKAYNYALSQAKSNGCRWLLLLDQDTNLPANFLASIHESIALTRLNSDIVAIVPVVQVGSRQVSPVLPRLGREIPFRMRGVVENKWLTAINSGACLRVEFIESIGGFCNNFWLDYLDHWLFKVINNNGKSVFVSHMVLQHDLSVANMNSGGLSVQRYKNVLAAERRFTNNFLPPLWRFILVPRLLARAVKHLVLTHNKRLGCLMVGAAATQLLALIRICRESLWRHGGRGIS